VRRYNVEHPLFGRFNFYSSLGSSGADDAPSDDADFRYVNIRSDVMMCAHIM
jgi:hypothetical protein